VLVTKIRWQQSFHGLANEGSTGPGEHFLQRPIGCHDDALRIHRKDALRGCLQQKPERSIALFVALRQKGIFRFAPFRDVQIQSRQTSDLSAGGTLRTAAALDPAHCTIGQHNSIGIVPGIPGWGLKGLVEKRKQVFTIIWMEAAHPSFGHRRF
jgi:hypothetical protein